MLHFRGDILSPNKDKRCVIVFNIVDMSGIPGTELHQEIKSRFPMMTEHWASWCRKWDRTPLEQKPNAGIVTVYFDSWDMMFHPGEPCRFYVADCLTANLMDITTNEIRTALLDTKDYDKTPIIMRIPYKLGMGEYMSDARWTDIMEMLRTEHFNIDIEIYLHESGVTPELLPDMS